MVLKQGGATTGMNAADLKGRRITIIGGGVSGKSLAALAQKLEASVFVTEEKILSPSSRASLKQWGITYEENGHTDKAWETDLVVASSGLSPNSQPVQEARKRKIPVIGELDFVAPFLKGKILAVTGSNGKTTTTALIGHLLSACGFRVKTVGNIGSPLADAAFEEVDFFVAELSSFQLHWANDYTVDLAIVTNLAPDHINWHGSYENYIKSKANLLDKVRPGGEMIVQTRDLKWLGHQDQAICLSWSERERTHFKAEQKSLLLGQEEACFITTSQEEHHLFRFDEVPLLGKHNLENAAMAFLACILCGAPEEELRKSLRSFQGLPHRCESVIIRNDIRYIDDSKGTNVAATITALESLPGKKIIILGGQGKGEDYRPLAQAVKRHARAAVLIGTEAENIQKSLLEVGFRNMRKEPDMNRAVLSATELARAGDSVLLSPACTSWDMYPNYKERGNHFQTIAREIGL